MFHWDKKVVVITSGHINEVSIRRGSTVFSIEGVRAKRP